jgi:hypothetical protein
VCPLKIYQNTKFHGPKMNVADLASTSEIWSGKSYVIRNHGVKTIFNGINGLLNSKEKQ